jgi:hypothetical protein
VRGVARHATAGIFCRDFTAVTTDPALARQLLAISGDRSDT